jgi:hypothetical protein
VDDGQATPAMTSVAVISCTAALAGDAKTNEVITTLKTAVAMIKAMVAFTIGSNHEVTVDVSLMSSPHLGCNPRTQLNLMMFAQ